MPLARVLRVARKVVAFFRGNAAVSNVDFDLAEGEVHAILGENGAGKSTLTKIIAGVVEPTSGTMLLDGRRLDINYAAKTVELT